MKAYEETKELLEHSAFYYIICTNMQGQYSYVNNHYHQNFSKIHGDIVGQPYQITMHADDVKICEEVAKRCFENPGRIFPATIRKHDGRGGYVITQWEYKALFNEGGQPEGIFCLGYDITDYMNDRDELEDAKTIIETKNNVLKEIAFNQSHIIRRPLANILGIASILDNMEMDANLRNLCTMLIESTQQLDEVIKSIVNKTYVERTGLCP